MKPYTIEDEAKFSESIQITETSDPAHADVINAAPKQLLKNTIVNKQGIEELQNPNFEEPPTEDDPEKAIEQIRPKKPFLELYTHIKSALIGILKTSKKALNIATGKSQAYVFDTVADLDAWLAVPDNTKKLNVGDNFYIVATDVPDYWWDGSTKQELEVQKIDLTTYDNAITALRSKDEELKQSLDNTVLRALSTNNYIDVLTNIGQITSIGFWKIDSIDSSYAQSIGITPNNNTGDFYAIVSNYNGYDNHFQFGNLQLYSPRLGTNYFTVQVWNEVARAECMIIHSNVLNTIEQVSACTESPFVAGALAAKAMMADYNNKINQINSNLLSQGSITNPDTVQTIFAIVNGWDSNITNVPSEFYHAQGMLITVWRWRKDFSLTGDRAQALIWANNLAFRNYDNNGWTEWTVIGK